MKQASELWCDGGLVLQNPSPFGGTWAWVALDGKGEKINGDSGIVTPTYANLPTVSNNLSELLAAVKALQWVPEGWRGKLFTDSRVTLLRLTHGSGFNGIPQFLRTQALELRRSRKAEVVLVGGHPTKKELALGYRGWWGRDPETSLVLPGSAGRIPVSKWNAWCDKKCKLRAREFIERNEATIKLLERKVGTC